MYFIVYMYSILSTQVYMPSRLRATQCKSLTHGTQILVVDCNVPFPCINITNVDSNQYDK